MNNPSFDFVVHKETQEEALKMQDGKYAGIVWQYADVRFPIYDESGNLIDPEAASEIPLTFKWKVLYNPNEADIESVEFNTTVGDILLQIIEEGLENDAIKINTASGEDNTSELDSE